MADPRIQHLNHGRLCHWNLKINDLGCKSENKTVRLNCLMDIDAESIVNTQNNGKYPWNFWQPTVKSPDGLFSDQPTALYQQGKTLAVPFVIGNNIKELNCGSNPISYQQLQSSLDGIIGTVNTQNAFAFYNVSDDGSDCANESCQIHTDLEVKCISRNMTASSAKHHQNQKHFVYQFEHGSSFNRQLYGGNDACWETPCHTAELWYVFYSPQAMKEQLNITFEENESVLAHHVDSYWTNFAKYPFAPNDKRNGGESIIQWNPFSNEDKQVLILDVDDKFRMVKNLDKDVCDFWDGLGWTWLL